MSFQYQRTTVVGITLRDGCASNDGARYYIIPGTRGRVTTWVDGVQVADQAGAVTANRYPKLGLYGDRTDPVTLTARYDNFEFGTADLTARITAPRVATPGWLI